MTSQAPVVVYGHALCPGVGPVRGLLKRSKVEHEYIDIRQNSHAAERVRTINNGNESVPTLEFSDGSTMTEPSVAELKVKLESMGYTVGGLAWLIGNAWKIVIGIAILLAVLRAFGVI
jgi:mycoredoxin